MSARARWTGRRADPAAVTLVVLAKAPIAGRVKTRLCPPCTPAEAARLAAAALADTLDAVAATPAVRRCLVMSGGPTPLVPPGLEVLAQRGDGLDERLAAAFADVGGPALLIGMDTPQVTPALLRQAQHALVEPGIGAVLGPATDGGFWVVGLRRPNDQVFLGVPMSTDATGAAQRERLARLGLRTAVLPELRDVDTVDDARVVAAIVPTTRFALAVRDVLVPVAGVAS